MSKSEPICPSTGSGQGSGRSSGPRILYMEDDVATARLLQKRLKRAGYVVDVAHDGEEGLALYAADSYDVVAVDQNMPMHDGLEVIRILTAQGPLPPTIMVTGAGDEKTAVEAMKLGASDYIVKDVDGGYLELLPSVVERALRQQRLVEEKQQAEEERERHNRELTMLNEIGRAVTSSLDLNKVLAVLLGRAHQGLGAEACSVALLDNNGDLVFHHAEGEGAEVVIGLRLKLGQGIAGHVAQSGQSALVPDAHADPRFYGEADPGFTTRDIVCVPLVVRDEIIGVIELINKCQGTFAEDDVRVLESVATQAATAIVNARLFGDVERAKAEWEATFDAIGDGISIHGREFRLGRVNHALAERLGTTPETLVGHACYELFHHTTAPPDWCPCPKATKTGQPQTVEVEEPVLGGTFMISAYPLFDEQGQVSGSVHVFKDITERKQLEAQLRQAQKMEAIGQLAGGIAHDFNNLLTPIGGFAELLLWKTPEGSKEQEYLRQIKVAAERAAALTRQLRLFTRQAGGERRPTQLNDVVEETHDLLEHSILKDITIELHLESELWAVEADPSQISQVLMNLCLNARDAMPDGGTLTLETRNVTLNEEYARTVLAARPGRYVCLSVSDTGRGMSPEVQARLFEPFFTTKEPGRGTGLGLAVVYGVVEEHNGFINVYSEEGQGSTFRVYLSAIESAVEEGEVETGEIPGGTETVLLVDDEAALRILGQHVLELCGYTVLMAENGLQALEVYQAYQREIGLVVLDVMMPRMGGRECLRRLRELDPRVKVLISTGYVADSTAQKLVAEGALGVVEKPFLPQDLAVAVRATLDKS